MADELRYKASATFNKGSVTLSSPAFNAAQTITGTNASSGTQSIGTSAEALAKGDIGTVGFLLLKNLDPTNYVELSQDAGSTFFGRILPLGVASLPVSATNIHVKANTAACVCQYLLVEQ